MANMTECKEPFMLPLSEFLNHNKSSIVKFIDEISSAQDDLPTPSESISSENYIDDVEASVSSSEKEEKLNLKYAECKYLAILHRLLNSLVPQMKLHLEKCTDTDDGDMSTSLANLIDILEDINHKVKLP